MLRLWICILLTLLMVLFACSSEAEPRPPSLNGSSNNQKPQPATPKPLELTSIELYQTYENNEILFEEDYKDKWAFISGEVVALEVAGSNYDVKLAGDEFGFDFGVIVCKVDKNDLTQADIAKNLTSGDEIVVLGKIDAVGFADMEVQDCTVEQVS